MLELKDLHKTFNPGTVNAKTALNGLSLTLRDGEFVTVIGGNGAGKLFRCCLLSSETRAVSLRKKVIQA